MFLIIVYLFFVSFFFSIFSAFIAILLQQIYNYNYYVFYKITLQRGQTDIFKHACISKHYIY